MAGYFFLFSFVRFKTSEGALTAVTRLHHAKMGGRTLVVRPSDRSIQLEKQKKAFSDFVEDGGGDFGDDVDDETCC